MRYLIDHDVHIHSGFSPCSSDPRQTPEAILAYGLTNGFRLLCLADHAWDDSVPTAHPIWGTLKALRDRYPSLPQGKTCRFAFGLEVDMDYDDVIGLSRAEAEKLDFFVCAAGHMHIDGFTALPADDAETRVRRYLERTHALLDSDLPLYKATLAHFTFDGVAMGRPLRWLALLTDRQLRDIFTKVKKRGMGVELNFHPGQTPAERDVQLRPFRIAKEVGCTFTLGGDAHHPESFAAARARLERLVDLLALEEKDKHPYLLELMKG